MNPMAMVLLVSAVFFVLFIAFSTGLFFLRGSMTGGTQKSAGVGGFFGGGSVGVVELNGVILDSKKTLKKLKSFEESPEIKAVVLRLNSPGGAVAPSQEIYEAVKDFKKPLVVSMSSVAASGAYYIAMGAKKVFANPGTITGSIGVIMEFANLEKLYDWAKIQRYSIKTGKFKDVGAEYKPMSAEDRELLQTMVDDVLVQFKTAVSDGRKMKMAEVDAIADGRIFSGSQAKKAGLVDTLGTLNDAVQEAADEAGIKGKPHVVYPEKRGHFLMDLISDAGNGNDDDSASSVSPLKQILSGVSHAVTGSASLTGLEPGVYWLWPGAR